MCVSEGCSGGDAISNAPDMELVSELIEKIDAGDNKVCLI